MKNGNEKEILDALRLIKKICATNDSRCGDCPFYNPSTSCCIVHNIWPEDWELIDESPSNWRAFKN